MYEVFNLLEKRISQSGESSHAHSHCKVLAFDMRSRYMLGIGFARYGFLFGADALGGAIDSTRSSNDTSLRS